MLKIILEEEYGYRTWLWSYPESKEQLIADWLAGNAPLNFFNPSKGNYKGTMERFEDHIYTQPKYDLLNEERPGKTSTEAYQEQLKQYQAEFNSVYPIQGHIHDRYDTYLVIDGQTYDRDPDMNQPTKQKEEENG